MNFRENELNNNGRVSIEEWLQPEYVTGVLAGRLEKQREREIEKEEEKKEKTPEEIGVIYDRSHRSLSEMPLCGVWLEKSNKDLIPQGFSVVKYGVLGSNIGVIDPHIFAFREGEILCPVPGLSLWPDSNYLKPGERVEYLVERAPGLVHLYDNGLAVLHGPVVDIGRHLGLWYRW